MKEVIITGGMHQSSMYTSGVIIWIRRMILKHIVQTIMFFLSVVYTIFNFLKKIESDSKQFIVRYFLYLMVLFIVFYADTSWLSSFISENQTNLTLSILNIFLDSGQLQGNDIWMNSHYRLIVNQSCNGMIPILFLYASILAYPSSFFYKIIWIIIGYFIFFVTNIVRILLVVYFVKEGGEENFYWSHDILGNALLILVGLLIFMAYIHISKKHC